MNICRFCGGQDLKVWAGRYKRCNDCLYICSVPEPTASEIDQHYMRYHDVNHQASTEKNSARATSYIQEILWLKEQVSGEIVGPVFDYGASGGYFLDALVTHVSVSRELVFGYDLSLDARQILSEKGYYRSVDSIDKGSMQLVVLRGVLEHLVDFRGAIRKLESLLGDDGVFFITATPDASCTVANVYRGDWVQHHYPSHFQHFTSALVDQLMAEVGLVLVNHVDLYRNSVYRDAQDDSNWLANFHGYKANRKHAYWGTMMTRAYKRIGVR